MYPYLIFENYNLHIALDLLTLFQEMALCQPVIICHFGASELDFHDVC